MAGRRSSVWKLPKHPVSGNNIEMRRIKTILCLLAVLGTVGAVAQEGNAVALARPKTTIESLASGDRLAGTKLETPSNKSSNELQGAPMPWRQAAQEQVEPYKFALGVKFLWGISVTGKYFFKEHSALEGIVRYRSYGGYTNDIAFTALYEHQKPIASVPGLSWMLGGGPYVGHSSFKSSYLFGDLEGASSTYFGINGIAGLEYRFESLPIAVSADWMPGVNFNGGGFGAENGGIGVKYLF